MSELINNKSSKIEYKELSIEENKLENKLLIVSVIICTMFICEFSKISPLYEIRISIVERIKSIAKIKA